MILAGCGSSGVQPLELLPSCWHENMPGPCPRHLARPYVSRQVRKAVPKPKEMFGLVCAPTRFDSQDFNTFCWNLDVSFLPLLKRHKNNFFRQIQAETLHTIQKHTKNAFSPNPPLPHPTYPNRVFSQKNVFPHQPNGKNTRPPLVLPGERLPSRAQSLSAAKRLRTDARGHRALSAAWVGGFFLVAVVLFCLICFFFLKKNKINVLFINVLSKEDFCLLVSLPKKRPLEEGIEKNL